MPIFNLLFFRLVVVITLLKEQHNPFLSRNKVKALQAGNRYKFLLSNNENAKNQIPGFGNPVFCITKSEKLCYANESMENPMKRTNYHRQPECCLRQPGLPRTKRLSCWNSKRRERSCI